MPDYFQAVKAFVLELECTISYENKADGMLVINKEQQGVKNLILGVTDPILIIEQHIFDIKTKNQNVYQSLLQKNRDIIHGAFVLDTSGKKVIFRDTLQLQNLDLNELEGTLNSLVLLLSEYSEHIINFSKQ